MAVYIKCNKLFPIGSCSFNWEIEEFYPRASRIRDKKYISEPFYIHELIPTPFCLSASFHPIRTSECSFYLEIFQEGDVILRNWKFNFSVTIESTSDEYAELINEDYNAYGDGLLAEYLGFRLFNASIKGKSIRISDKKIKLKQSYLKLKCNFKLFSNDSVAFPSIVSLSRIKPEDKKANICSALKNLYQSKELSDIIISIGKLRIKAHQLILMARSPVFKAMLGSSFQETKTRCIKVTDTDMPTFDCFLKYLYCGEIDELNFETACSLFKIADKYDVADLKHECREILKANITAETVIYILEFAVFYKDDSLKDEAVEFLKYSLSVMKSKRWMELCRQNPELVSEILYLLTPVFG